MRIHSICSLTVTTVPIAKFSFYVSKKPSEFIIPDLLKYALVFIFKEKPNIPINFRVYLYEQ